MCTSINYSNGNHYFGRNLDLEIDYPVDVVITPRNYEFQFRHVPAMPTHNAMIGMGLVEMNTPLYFEAINDKGLGMAGLAFFGEAVYYPPVEGKTNLASFEIIPYILGKCSTVEEAKKELENIVITNDSFSPDYPASQLHWQIGDKNSAIVVESDSTGMHVYDNPFGVLTNSPSFAYQKINVSYYLNCTGSIPEIRFAPDKAGFDIFSRGMGSIGLPGGTDSVSRFVRCCFAKLNSICDKEDYKNVAEYFHLLGVVQQTSGESEITPGQYEITQYTSCGNTDTGVFYFNTYYNPEILSVDMHKENLDSDKLISYAVPKVPTFKSLN